MSYTIKIGEAVVESTWDEYNDPHARWTVELVQLDQAPEFSDSGKTNMRSPGYSQWHDFTVKTGLYELFYKEHEGFLRPHPGCKPLKEEHYHAFLLAHGRYAEAHPKEIAGFCKCGECAIGPDKKDVPHNPLFNGNLVRLEWLVWERFHQLNCSEPGPNGLVRFRLRSAEPDSPVAEHLAVSHGDTWDCFDRDFL